MVNLPLIFDPRAQGGGDKLSSGMEGLSKLTLGYCPYSKDWREQIFCAVWLTLCNPLNAKGLHAILEILAFKPAVEI